VFAQMLRSRGHSPSLSLVTKIIFELVGRGKGRENIMIETLRTTPDFAVINKITKDVYLIEVKHRHFFAPKFHFSYFRHSSAK
jgi:hypothetical protein